MHCTEAVDSVELMHAYMTTNKGQSLLSLLHVSTTSKWLFILISGFILLPQFLSCVPHLSPTCTHAGASGHTVSLLAVTVVLVLECSTGGEGD